MHLIIAIVVLFVLYKLFKNYLAEIIVFGGIVLALIYYTEVTVDSLIALFAFLEVQTYHKENQRSVCHFCKVAMRRCFLKGILITIFPIEKQLLI